MRIVPAQRRFIPLGVEWIKRGYPAVLPTDTLYGICADALNPEAVERIYTLKWRNPRKPLIVLIEDLRWLEEFFKVKPAEVEKRLFLFGKPVSVLLPVEGFDWLTRGGTKIAFRLVKGGFIKEFLKALDRPIVAPSANWEGFPPAETPFQAYLYFGDSVPIAYDGGILRGKPSALCEIENNRLKVLRRGTLTEEDLKVLQSP